MTCVRTQGGRSDQAGSRSRRHRRARGDGGVALVEFAIVMPLLFALMLGTVTGGFALNQKQQITHATREGARYAASVAPNQTFVSGTWAENVRSLAIERLGPDLTADDVCVSLVQGSPGTVVLPIAGHSTAPANAPCIAGQTYPTTANDTGLRVQVTAKKQVKVQFIFGTVSPTISTQATAKSELPL